MATLTEFLTEIADAIRAKKGTSGAIPAPNFAAEIESIETGPDTSDATATAGDILSGKTAYGAAGKLTGTIPTVEQATPSISVSDSGLITASATQSAGYTAGGSKSATQQLTTMGMTNILPQRLPQVAVDKGVFTTGIIGVLGDNNLLPQNIKSGVSIFGVDGDYGGETITVDILDTGNYTVTLDAYYFDPDENAFVKKELYGLGGTGSLATLKMKKDGILIFYITYTGFRDGKYVTFYINEKSVESGDGAYFALYNSGVGIGLKDISALCFTEDSTLKFTISA